MRIFSIFDNKISSALKVKVCRSCRGSVACCKTQASHRPDSHKQSFDHVHIGVCISNKKLKKKWNKIKKIYILMLMLTWHGKVRRWNQTSDLLATKRHLLHHCGCPPMSVCRIAKVTRAFKFHSSEWQMCKPPIYGPFYRMDHQNISPGVAWQTHKIPAVFHCQNEGITTPALPLFSNCKKRSIRWN